MNKKIKVFVISDHPLSPSGVGTQTKYMIDALHKTGRYEFVCFGGAVRHENYQPMRVDQYGEDLIIYPVDGYGSPDKVRSLIRSHRPDMLWFMTDPRFYGWLWEIEDEVRALIPMVYYHVWDNGPYPMFNKKSYESTDVIVSISQVTNEIVKNVSPNTELHHIPHAVNDQIFRKIPKEDLVEFKKEYFGEKDKFTVFWNNRNARRKMTGSVIWWFSKFLEKVGKENARLVMHTDVRDAHGQDLVAIIERLGLTNQEVIFSQQKVSPEILSMLYNISDCTINIADAEGFGLGTLESLSCETPIIVNMTGGLQEQVTDGEEYFGVGIEPASKAIIGSQQVPYIYEDRVSGDDVVNALMKMYELSPEQREELGRKGRGHVMKNFGFELYGKRWVDLMDSIYERHGSWETRKGYDRWILEEIGNEN